MAYDYKLEFKHPIFSKELELLFPKTLGSFIHFTNNYLCDWLVGVTLDEFEAMIAYPIILENFKSNYRIAKEYNLTSDDITTISQYFDRLILDENEHFTLLEKLIFENFGRNIEVNQIETVKQRVKDRLQTIDLAKEVTHFYLGECYIWTGLYLFYKNTHNDNLKNIFHRLIIDESHHNNAFFKLTKKIQSNFKFDNDFFIKNVIRLRYLNMIYIKNKFNIENETSKKNRWWLNKVYNHDWHNTFNTTFLKKAYKMYSLFNPTVNFLDFSELINQNIVKEIDTKDK